MTFASPLALFRLDPITLNRPDGTADADGNPEGTYTTVYTGRGTLGIPTEHDVADASQRLTDVEQVVAIANGVDVRADDQLVCSRGTFFVVAVAQRRLYQRVLLRKRN
jgi:hypothetical protein